MSRRKKKAHHDEHIPEDWLLPYSDLLTLLLALFIVLFGMSSINAEKFNAMSEAFNSALSSGTGIFEYPSPMPENQAISPDEMEKDEETATEEQRERIEQLELENIQKKVNTYIKDNKLEEKLSSELTDEGLLLTIRDNVLFASGSATVRTQDLKIANEISELLVMNPPRNIIISGHTDNVPIRTTQFESNWELSVMRAINFMKVILTGNDKLDPSMFSAKGFGEFKPIASNDTVEGKAKNRRVEILILPITSKESL